ncbi:protein canopy 4-like [Oscarella lobularis]|uniref:protein canopy 4-like n=1 Tax=Oscarella lobularis TaxID=121494 RepID=UPI003313FCB1
MVLVGRVCFLAACAFLSFGLAAENDGESKKAEKPNHPPATKCEVCRLVSMELERQLDKTAKSGAVIGTGHRLDSKGNWESNKRIKYKNSEVRLMDALEGVCEQMYSYEIQEEDKAAFRYARRRNLEALKDFLSGMGDMMSRVQKLGIPTDMHSMIDPNGDLRKLKLKCDSFIEDYEDDITDWYKEHQEMAALTQFLCVERAVKENHTCLAQEFMDSFTEDVKEENDKKAADSATEQNAKEDENVEEIHAEEIDEIQSEDVHTEL